MDNGKIPLVFVDIIWYDKLNTLIYFFLSANRAKKSKLAYCFVIVSHFFVADCIMEQGGELERIQKKNAVR